jgi:hypothetical protein
MTDNDKTPIRLCHACGETMSEEHFQEGKMCCDHPLFDEDEDDDEWEAQQIAGCTCHSCSEPLRAGHVIWGCDENRNCGCETWFCEDCADNCDCCKMCSDIAKRAADKK